jgi:hypothetical protein
VATQRHAGRDRPLIWKRAWRALSISLLDAQYSPSLGVSTITRSADCEGTSEIFRWRRFLDKWSRCHRGSSRPVRDVVFGGSGHEKIRATVGSTARNHPNSSELRLV